MSRRLPRWLLARRLVQVGLMAAFAWTASKSWSTGSSP